MSISTLNTSHSLLMQKPQSQNSIQQAQKDGHDFIKFLKENNPQAAKKLAQAAKENPKAMRQLAKDVINNPEKAKNTYKALTDHPNATRYLYKEADSHKKMAAHVYKDMTRNAGTWQQTVDVYKKANAHPAEAKRLYETAREAGKLQELYRVVKNRA